MKKNKKNSKSGLILQGNRPNFFVERMTLSQTQAYCLKSGKMYISISKITEHVGKFWKKWHHKVLVLAKNSKAGGRFSVKFCKAGCH